jgi:hypothetical protein
MTFRLATKNSAFTHAGGGDAFAILPVVTVAPADAMTDELASGGDE